MTEPRRIDRPLLRKAAALRVDRTPYAASPDCERCQANGPGPSHNGSRGCRSGSIASGGHRAHCSCSTCY